MTRKDFELIAQELRMQHQVIGVYADDRAFETAVMLWGATLRNLNPNFDLNRFKEACNKKVEVK